MTQRAQCLRAEAQPKNGKPQAYILRVPVKLAELVPHGTQFLCELTEDGILFRPVSCVASLAAPSWCDQETTA